MSRTWFSKTCRTQYSTKIYYIYYRFIQDISYAIFFKNQSPTLQKVTRAKVIKNSFQIRKCPQYSIFQTRKRGKNYTIHFTPHTTYVRSYIYKQAQREGEKWRGRERKGRDRRKEGKRGKRRKGVRQGTKKGEKEKEWENSWLCHVVFEISYIWFPFRIWQFIPGQIDLSAFEKQRRREECERCNNLLW